MRSGHILANSQLIKKYMATKPIRIAKISLYQWRLFFFQESKRKYARKLGPINNKKKNEISSKPYIISP